MKQLLIPTDFSLLSLNAVHAAVSRYGMQQLNIMLFHLLRMPGDLSEFLFPRRARHHKLVSPDFTDACQVLQNKYADIIVHMEVRFAQGGTAAYLRNFLEGERIDHIVVCPDIKLGIPSERSIAMLPMLKKTGFPIDYVPLNKSEARNADLNILHMSMAAN